MNATILALALCAPGSGYSSCYYPGYSYWPGGHYCGDSYWSSGYYRAGYYRSYVHYEEPCVKPTFIRYLAVLPLAELPTYAAYHVGAGAGAGVSAPVSAPASAPTPAPAPAPAVSSSLEVKVDRVLVLLENQGGRIARLEEAVFGGGGSGGGGSAAADPVPVLMQSACARCHDEKAALTLGKGFVMFVGGQLAAMVDKKPARFPKDQLQKMKAKLVAKQMPPLKDAAGAPLPPLPDAQRKDMVAWIDKELARRD